jgi:hypothetical protein
MKNVHFLLLDQGNSSPSDHLSALKQNLDEHKFMDDRRKQVRRSGE